MPTVIQATDNETPDSGQAGTSAVTGSVDTGHDATTCSVSVGPEDSDSQTKSDRWFTFTGPAASAINLTFSWSISGAGLTLTGANVGVTTASASFTVEYSTNGGSSWTTALTRTFSRDSTGNTAISDSGNENVSLSVVLLSQIQVRDTISAAAASAGDAAVLAEAEIIGAINTIQLSIEPATYPTPVCVW